LRNLVLLDINFKRGIGSTQDAADRGECSFWYAGQKGITISEKQMIYEQMWVNAATYVKHRSHQGGIIIKLQSDELFALRCDALLAQIHKNSVVERKFNYSSWSHVL
jgi:hypothetical protein